MKRDINKLNDQIFDIIIIGGGIHGAAAAYQLAQAGYHIALIEQNDFCHATSANSLKILHGGLRYLQHCNIKRMRDSIRSRRDFMLLAPHLARPLPCVMPTTGHGLRGKLVMRLALFINDLISFDRNKGLPEEKRLGRGKILSRKQCQQIIPGIESLHPTGAALWYDGLLVNTERMVLQLLHKAARKGNVIANYVKAEEIVVTGRRVESVIANDLLSNRKFPVKCRMLVNCAGPWIDEVTGNITGKDKGCCLAKAVNIIVNRSFFGEYAVGLEGTGEFIDQDALVQRGKRLFFFVPWRGKTMIGTIYTHSTRDEPLSTSENDIRIMIEEINMIYPPAKLDITDVTFSHTGFMPAYELDNNSDGSRDPCLIKHSKIIDHEQLQGIQGILSVQGVKYTTAIDVARRLELIIRRRKITKSGSRKTGFSAGGNYTRNILPMQPDGQKQFPHIVPTYGDQAPDVFRIMETDPSAADLVSADPPLTKAEVVYAIQNEMAHNLPDMIFRRTDIGSGQCPPRQVLDRLARLMGVELGWTNEQMTREVENVLLSYTRRAVPLS